MYDSPQVLPTMTVSPGARFGPYQILSALPKAFAADSERVARFEREWKLLASLNHPNLAAIARLSLPLVGVP